MSNIFLQNDLRDDDVDPSRETEFLSGLAAAYHDIYACSLAILGNRDDTDDVVQEVCVVLWQKFDEFEPGTSFKKWACAVTFNAAKSYARKRRRNRGFGLSDHALARITHVHSGGSELFELQREVLRECLDKLAIEDRKFLSECYRKPASLTHYAREIGQSVETIYTKLKRLRRRLTECAKRTLGEETR